MSQLQPSSFNFFLSQISGIAAKIWTGVNNSHYSFFCFLSQLSERFAQKLIEFGIFCRVLKTRGVG